MKFLVLVLSTHSRVAAILTHIKNLSLFWSSILCSEIDQETALSIQDIRSDLADVLWFPITVKVVVLTLKVDAEVAEDCRGDLV